MANKQFKQHRQFLLRNGNIGGVVLLCLFILGEIGLLTATFIISPQSSTKIQILETENKNTLEEKARAITVKIVSGEFWGSGIIIAKQGNSYQVLTNDHVLNEETEIYQIYTPDNQVYQGTVVASGADFEGNDLAILTFETENKSYPLAKFGRPPQAGDEVFAAGFPIPKLNEENKGWVMTKGVIWRLLDKPLRDGYQLGYTNEIEKGMSGGALFNENGEVIAINGMHAYPLLGRPYMYEDGTVPDEALIEEMVHHSFGIPNKFIPPWVFSCCQVSS